MIYLILGLLMILLVTVEPIKTKALIKGAVK